jgi:hypothetical protein
MIHLIGLEAQGDETERRGSDIPDADQVLE